MEKKKRRLRSSLLFFKKDVTKSADNNNGFNNIHGVCDFQRSKKPAELTLPCRQILPT